MSKDFPLLFFFNAKMLCFKEWHLICEALKAGQQSLILRKGGIHEGKTGFSFQEGQEFLLFPTRFHAQEDALRGLSYPATAPRTEWQLGEEIAFETLCRVESTHLLEDLDSVEALLPYHHWSSACINDRFFWEEKKGQAIYAGSIHLALLRVYTLQTPYCVPYQKRFGGCRSWVELEEVPRFTSPQPVLSDQAFARLKSAIYSLLPAS